MAKAPGIDQRDFVAGTVALGAAGAAVDIVFWPVMPPDRVRERILEFGRALRA